MAKIIEPPVLMSRVLTFVLATSVVVLAVLVFSALAALFFFVVDGILNSLVGWIF